MAADLDSSRLNFKQFGAWRHEGHPLSNSLSARQNEHDSNKSSAASRILCLGSTNEFQSLATEPEPPARSSNSIMYDGSHAE
jgi:hypothetical protein